MKFIMILIALALLMFLNSKKIRRAALPVKLYEILLWKGMKWQ